MGKTGGIKNLTPAASSWPLRVTATVGPFHGGGDLHLHRGRGRMICAHVHSTSDKTGRRPEIYRWHDVGGGRLFRQLMEVDVVVCVEWWWKCRHAGSLGGGGSAGMRAL
jgi:hypothetical protein